MSRRPPNPAAERAAQNQQTIKSLLKLETNKICADCKRNKHPRWASWNLGVFICIRCSGIHRGMGTHISRVKSVDLDSWTDEQLQSILSWGNARANKYWESKLAPGHVPSESKIENFIRTKYELKRWVMDGPKPDPATLDVDGDDDIPLSIVKEKQNIDRKESIRKSPAQGGASASLPKPAPPVDLIGGTSPVPPPPRANTAGPAAAQVAPKGVPAPPKATSHTAKDSLLGLDFLGSQPSAPARPSSTTGSLSSGGPSRPDLKQSILSLYATAPRTTSPATTMAQQQQPARPAVVNDPFANLGSPTMSARNSIASGGSGGGGGGGLVDAFSSLSFSSAPAPTTSPKPVDAFANLSHSRPGSTVSHAAHKSSSSAFGSLSGGSFFNAKPAAAAMPTTTSPKPAAASSSSFGGLSGFGAFSSTPSPPAPQAAAAAASNAFGDLFDFTSPAATPAAAAPAPAAVAPAPVNSVFNLSSAQPMRAAATAVASAATAVPTSPLAAVSANWSNADVWGNDGWSTADAGSSGAAAASSTSASATITNPGLARANDFGWGSTAAVPTSTTSGSFASQSIVPGTGGGFAPAPKVAADEEFGGWTSGTTTTTTTTSGTGNGNAKATGGFGGNDDLFSNVWG